MCGCFLLIQLFPLYVVRFEEFVVHCDSQNLLNYIRRRRFTISTSESASNAAVFVVSLFLPCCLFPCFLRSTNRFIHTVIINGMVYLTSLPVPQNPTQPKRQLKTKMTLRRSGCNNRITKPTADKQQADCLEPMPVRGSQTLSGLL